MNESKVWLERIAKEPLHEILVISTFLVRIQFFVTSPAKNYVINKNLQISKSVYEGNSESDYRWHAA